ncbi:MAG TPA: hypothetical protein PKD17_04515 [Cellvibrionaceae bacterium]|nr:hypothetical protein [Cellvibrionaceae bacterium]
MLRKIAIFITWSLAIAAAQASDFGSLHNPNPGQPKLFIGQSGEPNEDLLIPAAANTSGVSFNTTTSFKLDRPLKIINTVDAASANGLKTAAKLIIIQSSNISLGSEIELIGETADLLIITNTSAASLSCNNCGFKNFGRLTLANAVSQTLSTSTTSIGAINLAAVNGLLSVGNLSAPGIVSLELLAQNLQITGAINTNQKAVNHPAGGFEINPTGNLTVTSGGVNIFATNMVVNYEEAKVTSTTPRDAAFTLGGSINAASVNIKVATPLTLATTISTRGDVLANAVYRGKPSLMLEGISVNTLGTSDTKVTNLNINSSLSTDGIITLNVGGALNVNAPIFAYQVNTTTLGKTYNSNTITSNVATFASNNFENNGLIKAENVTVSTDNEIQNRFGGHILASNINLMSTQSYIRNGSSMPFKPSNETLVLTADQSNTTDLSSMVFGGLNYTGATKVANLSARILGKNIRISAAKNVENINPYFVFTKDPDSAWSSGIPFDSYAAARVSLVAENTLKIASGSYVLNSSAIMGVNTYTPAQTIDAKTVDTPFLINAPNIANERYLVKVLADPILSSNGVGYDGASSSKDLVAKIYMYSPPGIIYSFAPVGMQFSFPGSVTPMANPGGFINNTAYFEALSDAYFMGQGSVSTLGLLMEKENFFNAQTTLRSADECNQMYKNGTSEQIGRCMTTVTTTIESGGTTVQTDLKNTLFTVAGKMVGDLDKTIIEGKFSNHQALDDIKADILNTYTGNYYSSGSNSPPVAGSSNTWENTAKLSQDGKYIEIWHHSVTKLPTGTEINDTVIDRILSWDVLVNKLTEIKTAFIKALDTFIAWLNG